MMSGLDKKYPVQINVVSKPFSEYRNLKYQESKLPVAPAIMIGQEVLVQGQDIQQHDLEKAIRARLGN